MFIGERGASYIPPFLQTKRVPYTFTVTDVTNGFAMVDVEWDVPFEDTNYTIVWGVYDTDLVVDLNFFVGDTHFKTKNGFTAVVGGDGGSIEVYAIAVHD